MLWTKQVFITDIIMPHPHSAGRTFTTRWTSTTSWSARKVRGRSRRAKKRSAEKPLHLRPKTTWTTQCEWHRTVEQDVCNYIVSKSWTADLFPHECATCLNTLGSLSLGPSGIGGATLDCWFLWPGADGCQDGSRCCYPSRWGWKSNWRGT